MASDTKIVVSDLSVAYYTLFNAAKKDYLTDPNELDAWLTAQLAHYHSLGWLLGVEGTKGPLLSSSFIHLYAQDSKPYWRTQYLLDATESIIAAQVEANVPKKQRSKGPIVYKGGRKENPPAFQVFKQMVDRKLERWGANLVKVPNYEADDIAAAVCMLYPDNPVLLLTIDSDWLGLLRPGVDWYCMTNHYPRLRSGDDLTNLREWSARRLGLELDKPQDIWYHKAKVGDKSDNLPAMSPIEVISLLNPPDEHKLWLEPKVAAKLTTLEADQPTTKRYLGIAKWFNDNKVRAVFNGN